MFEKVKKNFGFGCMRLPMLNGEVDYKEFSLMIDKFIESGFNYFDTAHGYLGGKSETAIRDCLSARYPRESFVLTNKLSNPCFSDNSEIIPLFEEQLRCCGVDYFDFYLMHSQNKKSFEKFKQCRAYETALELKAQGRIKHFGLSFHDKAEVLDEILTEYPQIEVVQIQFNYADYEDELVESRKCYEVCRKHNKPIIVMEPVKGGKLASLPDDAQCVFDSLGDASAASYAIRYAAGFDGVFMVLSGMGNMAMMNDNLSYMAEFKPLNETEAKAVETVRTILETRKSIQCTSCRYCVDGCPSGIPISDVFTCLNRFDTWHDWSAGYYYNKYTQNGNRASTCIECGACEDICPQHLPIRELLKKAAEQFEKEDD